MSFDIDTIETGGQSATAAICENAQLFGAAPERDEFDSRELWDRDDALDAVAESFRILAQGVAPDGFQLADERESLLWGFVNMLDSQDQPPRPRRRPADARAARPAARPGRHRDQVARAGADHRRARRTSPTAATPSRSCATPPPRPTARTPATPGGPGAAAHASQTGKLTSAAIDARDFQRARKDRETTAHLPQGTLVAIAGGKDVQDPAAVIAKLDQTRAKYADIVLVHGGGPGVERIAARWAERNGVDQVVCKPDWDRHGRAAPFRRNEELLNLLPKGVIAFPGSGITENLVDRARQLGIPVMAA